MPFGSPFAAEEKDDFRLQLMRDVVPLPVQAEWFMPVPRKKIGIFRDGSQARLGFIWAMGQKPNR